MRMREDTLLHSRHSNAFANTCNVQEDTGRKDKSIAGLTQEMLRLKDELAKKPAAPESQGTKVVVVTPKITVTMPDGTAHDQGKMNLPKHVLQVCTHLLLILLLLLLPPPPLPTPPPPPPPPPPLHHRYARPLSTCLCVCLCVCVCTSCVACLPQVCWSPRDA